MLWITPSPGATLLAVQTLSSLYLLGALYWDNAIVNNSRIGPQVRSYCSSRPTYRVRSLYGLTSYTKFLLAATRHVLCDIDSACVECESEWLLAGGWTPLVAHNLINTINNTRCYELSFTLFLMIRVYSTFTWQFLERGDNGFNYKF